MEDNKNTSLEGKDTDTKTFTQEEVNHIVQERLAKEKSKYDEENKKRSAELDMRERKMNAVQKLRDNNLPDYLADALNMTTDEAFEESMNAVLKMKGEKQTDTEPKVIGKGSLIGQVGGMSKDHIPEMKEAFGLR